MDGEGAGQARGVQPRPAQAFKIQSLRITHQQAFHQAARGYGGRIQRDQMIRVAKPVDDRGLAQTSDARRDLLRLAAVAPALQKQGLQRRQVLRLAPVPSRQVAADPAQNGGADSGRIDRPHAGQRRVEQRVRPLVRLMDRNRTTRRQAFGQGGGRPFRPLG
ncbi:MAG: hypothetical protein A2352_03395 [Caulobacterales bacterium RIFOXYB1_FULL_67_16]|nr:MAG: hypothetical protein A2352_03395 [Caulobacterales bacterium RIFOXYB1_FULL_67_16]